MGLRLGQMVPNFVAETTAGEIEFHKYIENSWAILFSHPADFTPVCTTEMGALGYHLEEFQRRGVKVLGLSCNEVESHEAWIEDIEVYTPGARITFPILADPNRSIAVKFGMLDPSEKDCKGSPMMARAVFVIGTDKRLKLSILYPATTGRNFHEILRAVDSLQLADKFKVATPVDWQHGDKCMVIPALSDEAALEAFPLGFEKMEVPSGRGYIRITPQPNL